jgi:hypothetical protein
MFSYSCPSCTQKLLAPPERVGQRTICPKCLRPLTIPPPTADDPDDSDDLFGGPLVDPDVHNTPLDHVTPPPLDGAVDDGNPHSRIDFDERPDPVSAPVPVPAPRPQPAPARPPAPPRPARVAAVVPAPRREGLAGAVVLNPTGLAAVDLAADLTAALTLRMKPPPEPAADGTVPNGAWFGLTVVALGLWVVGVIYDPAALPFVALIGGLQLAFGYLWGAYLAGRTDWRAGLLTLLPPVAAARFARPFGENAYRPQRFVLTGAVLLALFFAGRAARDAVQPMFDQLLPPRTPADPAPPPSPADRLQTALDRKQAEVVTGVLAELARPEAVTGVSDEARAKLAFGLKRLCDPAAPDPRPEVRTAALAALGVWEPDATRRPVLAALTGDDPSARRVAFQLAGRWKDAEVARAVVARLADRQEQQDAQQALLAIGGPPAEAALIPLLFAEDQGALVLTVIDLLEQVGGPDAVAALGRVAESGPYPSVREEAAKRAAAITARLKRK